MRALRGLVAVGVVWVTACNCGDGVTVGGNYDGGAGGGATSAGGGAGGGAAGGSGGAGADGGTCGNVSAQAALGKKPVDIIFVIDNSCSMTEEIIGVQANINASFAQIIGTSGLDYRVIMLSRHGSASSGQSICVSAPLSGNATCTPPPAQPTNTATFFHYSAEISSTNSYTKIASTYHVADEFNLAPQGWQAWLRPSAFKVFVEITDDNASGSSAAFETALFALQPAMFGTAANRNYVWHSITGIAAKSNAADPYLPTEPAQSSKCPSGVNPGLNYQSLSITTGGLRFPVCDPSLFATVFRKVAEGVVAGAQVACEFAVPAPPPGYGTSNRVIVNYTPGNGGPVQAFSRAMSAAACAPNKFYLENNKVIFCPDTCAVVRSDTGAKVDVIFTCEPEVN